MLLPPGPVLLNKTGAITWDGKMSSKEPSLFSFDKKEALRANLTASDDDEDMEFGEYVKKVA